MIFRFENRFAKSFERRCFVKPSLVFLIMCPTCSALVLHAGHMWRCSYSETVLDCKILTEKSLKKKNPLDPGAKAICFDLQNFDATRRISINWFTHGDSLGRLVRHWWLIKICETPEFCNKFSEDATSHSCGSTSNSFPIRMLHSSCNTPQYAAGYCWIVTGWLLNSQ